MSTAGRQNLVSHIEIRRRRKLPARVMEYAAFGATMLISATILFFYLIR